MGGRSERNEYLLLHAFHKAGYVAPNKYQRDFKNKQIYGDGKTGEEDGEKAHSRTKKAQYIGGLVLEPKIGKLEVAE